MATNSYGFAYPLTDDQVDVPAHIKNAIDSIGPYSNMRFANASARDALLTSPIEGMKCWLNDINAVTVYTGSAWVALWPGALPAAQQSYDGGTRTVTATSWAAIPSGTASVSITNPSSAYALECDVYYGSWMSVSASDLRACPVASGGVTLAAGPGGICQGWGQIAVDTQTGGTLQATGYGRLSIPGGASAVTVAVQAYRTAASGTQTLSYLDLSVVPRRFV
jgi:hypothetical protein